MRVVHLSFNESSGGAARAAHGLHTALVAEGVDSRMLVAHRQSDDPRVEVVDIPVAETRAWNVVEERWISRERSDVSNTFFSTGGPGFALAAHPLIQSADILNLHWIPRLAAPRDIGDLLALGKPVVWTLHDEWAYTGGCHYASGCEKWRTRCDVCPQLRRDPYEFVKTVFDAKIAAYTRGNLIVASPSRWLARTASESALLRGRRVVCIPYGVDLDTFHPSRREAGRARLGVREDEAVVLFSADSAAERRKGFAQLHAALEIARSALAASGCAATVRLAVLGHANPATLPAGAVATGHLSSRIALAEVVAASDLYVLPSLEDNLPNGVLEALSCGTPCIGFDVGGVPDMLAATAGCELAPVGDAGALGAAIARSVRNLAPLRDCRTAIRREAERRYHPRLQALGYLALYQEVCAAASRQNDGTTDVMSEALGL
jgi:glycosyltransferase involved in cell wall biosynthesis